VSKLLDHAGRLKPPIAYSAVQALWPLVAAIGVGLLMFYVVGPWLGGYRANIAVFIGINIILAVSLTLVNGFTGQFSMGHAGFMALGGYAAASVVYYGSMKFWGSAEFAGGGLSYSGLDQFAGPLLGKGDVLLVIACLVGGLSAAVAGYVVGLPSLRLRGDYLAIVTLGFGEIVRVLLQGTGDQIQPWKAASAEDIPWYKLLFMLGGPKGFNLLPTYATLFWVYLAVVLTLVVIYRLKMSSSGRAFLSIREDEVAAQAMGVDITRYKVRAFVLSSFFAGIAGALFGLYIGSINASELGFLRSFDIIIMVVLGGMGSISGATLAAIILTIVPEVLRDPPPVWPAGAFILLVMLVVQAWRRRWSVKSFIFVALTTAALEFGRQYCLSQGKNPADYRLILYALMLILMMILRPDGLFGVNEIWDYFKAFRRGSVARRARRIEPKGGLT
jgi:branched-chain amino acid transport system permease protein